MFIAKHCSISTIDHLTSLLQNCATKESPLERLKLHKTKCTSIIKNVISPSLLESLISDIGQSKYSLIVDESTDISQNKWMCICVRFFNQKNSQIVTHFLGIFLVEATALNLFQGMVLFLLVVKIYIYLGALICYKG